MIDMHIHTVHSDGNNSVKNIFELANKLNLSTISITDHNTVSAYEEITNNNLLKLYNGILVSGVELKCSINKEIIELLIYDFDIEKMKKFIYENYFSWEYINKNMSVEFEKILINRNVIYDKKIIDTYDFSKHNGIIELYKSVIEIADNIPKIDGILCENVFEFVRKYVCDINCMFYVDLSKYYPSVENIFKFVKQNDGKIFMPHVYLFNNGINILKNIQTNYNIDGVECYHPSYTSQQCRELLGFCKKYDLYVSAGSDYHDKDYDLGNPSKFYDNSNIKLFECKNKIK